MKRRDKMLEMEYQDRLTEPITLAHGEYKHYTYYILSFGSHPTAYVEVPRGHPLWFKEYDVCSRFINVHGGLTYSNNYLHNLNTGEWTIGWDYAHADDCYYSSLFSEVYGKQYKTKEIFADVKSVINYLIELKHVVELLREDLNIPLEVLGK